MAEDVMDFMERVDTLARIISEDSEAMLIVIKRQSGEDMTPIVIKSGDPFTINGIAEYAMRNTSDSLQYHFSEYYVVEEDWETEDGGDDIVLDGESGDED